MQPAVTAEPDPDINSERVERANRAKSCLTVLANRLPVHRNSDGAWEVSPGGLVSALMPVLRTQGGRWIGWGGSSDDYEGAAKATGVDLEEIAIAEEDFELYYTRVSNGVLWPLFHDRLRQPDFSHEAWKGYRRVNRQFAKRAASTCPQSSMIWIQDYHMLLVPGMLRQLRPDLRIGLFLHTPVPPASLFQTLPWRKEIIKSLNAADCIGTQTEDDRINLAATITSELPDDGTIERRVQCFPISIDSRRYEQAARLAEKSGAAATTIDQLGADRTIYLGVDRLDYTKGLEQRLKAFEHAFNTGLIDPHAVRFLQIAVPSRRQVDDYQEVGAEVDMLVGRINGTYSGVGDPIIHYNRHSMSADDLAALYRAADVMVVTPLKDGMNLVAKEFVASRFDATGELILSEFAGASRELSQATIVNPNDLEALANAIARAHRQRRRGQRRAEMEQMHNQVMKADVFRWADRFLRTLAGEYEVAS